MKNPEASKFILAIARDKKGGKLDRLSKIKISACGSKMKKNKKK